LLLLAQAATASSTAQGEQPTANGKWEIKAGYTPGPAPYWRTYPKWGNARVAPQLGGRHGIEKALNNTQACVWATSCKSVVYIQATPLKKQVYIWACIWATSRKSMSCLCICTWAESWATWLEASSVYGPPAAKPGANIQTTAHIADIEKAPADICVSVFFLFFSARPQDVLEALGQDLKSTPWTRTRACPAAPARPWSKKQFSS
jgi:hypothetical protein